MDMLCLIWWRTVWPGGCRDCFFWDNEEEVVELGNVLVVVVFVDWDGVLWHCECFCSCGRRTSVDMLFNEQLIWHFGLRCGF